MNRNIERDMYDYMPKIYEDLRESRAIVTTESVEFRAYADSVSDVLAQFYVNTATWGLADWERRVGIVPDEGKPIDQRRSVIKSKLRGAGVVTKSLIKNVAESYSNGEVDVAEDADNFEITITFVGTFGVPPNMDDLSRVLRSILPAHLRVLFKFKYRVYEDFTTVPYKALIPYSYSELLTKRIEYSGFTYVEMSESTHQTLSTYTQGELKGGEVSG